MGAQFTVQIDDVTLEPGRVIGGRYKLSEHLGQGGFAQVFKAHDTRIERDVAIKCLNLHSSNSERMGETIIERFEREAKLAAQISHPGVVNIFDYGVLGQSESVPYIVMELLSGWDLDEELRERGPMDAERAIPLFVTCLEALGRAHRKGIVHKDLKPANLFLANPGERDEALRIVDFGIAHMRTAVENRLTNTGEILGTPQYLAPEYIERQAVEPALDVYQMGLVLVEALTGEPAVSRDHHLLTLQAHSTGEIDVPLVLLESPLAPVLLRAMALDPAERYADGLEFADALAEVDPQTVPFVPSGAPKRRLAGAAGVSAERAGAATVPVTTSGQGSSSDDDAFTQKVLYGLVAGLAGAVLLAALAVFALMGDEGPDEPKTPEAAASSPDQQREDGDEGADKADQADEEGEARDREAAAKSETPAAPAEADAPRDEGRDGPPAKDEKPRKRKGHAKKDKKKQKKLQKTLEKAREDSKKVGEAVEKLGGALEGFGK